MNENKQDGVFEIKWENFFKRYKELCPDASRLAHEIRDRIKEIYEKTSQYFGEKSELTFEITEKGMILCSEPFVIMLGAIGEVIKKEQDIAIKKLKDELEKTRRYLRYAIPELENLIECSYCKEYNPPDKKYCIHCQKQIIKEELNGKKE